MNESMDGFTDRWVNEEKEKNMQRYAKVFTKKVKGIESIGKYAK